MVRGTAVKCDSVMGLDPSESVVMQFEIHGASKAIRPVGN